LTEQVLQSRADDEERVVDLVVERGRKLFRDRQSLSSLMLQSAERFVQSLGQVVLRELDRVEPHAGYRAAFTDRSRHDAHEGRSIRMGVRGLPSVGVPPGGSIMAGGQLLEVAGPSAPVRLRNGIEQSAARNGNLFGRSVLQQQ